MTGLYHTFYNILTTVEQYSTCKLFKSGALLLDGEKIKSNVVDVLVIGYRGTPSGWPHCQDDVRFHDYEISAISNIFIQALLHNVPLNGNIIISTRPPTLDEIIKLDETKVALVLYKEDEVTPRFNEISKYVNIKIRKMSEYVSKYDEQFPSYQLKNRYIYLSHETRNSHTL